MKEKEKEGRTTSRIQSPIEFEIVAKAVAKVRKASRKSQSQLSKELGKDRAYVGKIERQIRFPDVPTFLRIFVLCDADPSETIQKIIEQIEKETK